MILQIERRDNRGNITNQKIRMPWLAFIKHMAISGQGFVPSIKKFKRMLGMFFVYSDYLRYSDFQKSKFSKPPKILYDPTSTGQFSNIAGKAIADFLVKRLDNAKITFNYEAALRQKGLPINGTRPDLLCVNSSDIFSAEAKGRSKGHVSNTEMNSYKRQAQSGSLFVKFSVASISYNLYNQVEVKYYDPKNDDFEYDKELVKNLSIKYYKGIKELLNEEIFDIKREFINNRNYYKVSLSPHKFFDFYPLYPFFIKYSGRISILIDNRIASFVENGLDDFEMEQYFSNENIYIDSDGIGLIFSNYCASF